MGFGKTAADFGKGLLGKLKTDPGEVALRIARNDLQKLGIYDKAGKVIGNIDSGTNEMKNVADKLIKKGMSADDADMLIKRRAKHAKSIDDFMSRNKDKIAGKTRQDEFIKNNLAPKVEAYKKVRGVVGDDTSLAEQAKYALSAGMAYATEPGKMGARIGTYATVAVGGRILSGGDVLHNNTGERDIAGIPFF